MGEHSTTALERALCGYATRVGAGELLAAPVPWIAQRLVDDLGDGELGFERMVECIEADPLLAFSVLCTANQQSSHSALTKTVVSAVQSIGRRLTLRAVFSAGAGVSKKTSMTPLSSLRRLMWRRSVMTATLCRALAPHYGVSPDEAYLCGLLRDVGVFVALDCLENPLRHSPSAERLNARQCAELCVRLRTTVASHLMADCSLPREIVSAACGGETSIANPSPLVKLATAASYAVAQQAASVEMSPLFGDEIPFVENEEQRRAFRKGLRGLCSVPRRFEQQTALQVHSADDVNFSVERDSYLMNGFFRVAIGVAEIPVWDSRISYTALSGVTPTSVKRGEIVALQWMDEEDDWELQMCVTSCVAQADSGTGLETSIAGKSVLSRGGKNDVDSFRITLEPIVFHDYERECWLRAVGTAIVRTQRETETAAGLFDRGDGCHPLRESDFFAVGTNVGARRPVEVVDDKLNAETHEFVLEPISSPPTDTIASLAWVAMPVGDIDD